MGTRTGSGSKIENETEKIENRTENEMQNKTEVEIECGTGIKINSVPSGTEIRNRTDPLLHPTATNRLRSGRRKGNRPVTVSGDILWRDYVASSIVHVTRRRHPRVSPGRARRKSSWYSPFLCSVLIVLLFCDDALSKCSGENCLNGECRNETCVCDEGWQGPECQYCGGKIKLTAPSGVITDGPGNYSVSVQCSWLLDPPWLDSDPPPIRVRLETFATECGWDHLYVYDGDSVRAQRLLAVFSGVLDQTGSAWTRQVVARSGRALLHFFSDDAYAMEGFNITYAAYSCPSDNHHTNCSEHGDCVNGICRCFDGWVGIACDQPICPSTCTPRGCICEPTHSGEDCSRERARHSWSWLWREPHEGASQPPPGAPPPAAAYSLLQYNDTLLRVGGETFAQAEFLYKYIVEQRRWEAVETRSGPAPAPRFAHSAVVHGHELIMYGGVVASDEPERGGGLAGLEGRAGEVTNEVWRLRLDAVRPQWRNTTPTACHPHHVGPMGHCGGLHVSGHTAVVVDVGAARKPVMLVFFGHSPVYGYLNTVLEYHIEEGFWTSVATRGWPARAGFGHTAVYDNLSHRIYVHGGLVSESEATQVMYHEVPSAALFEYDIDNRVWRPLPKAPTPRYLHSATFISPGMMLVFGGNAHNDTAAATVSNPANAKCYSGGALLYDVRCSVWRQLQTPQDAARAAHAAQVMPGIERSTAVIMGGFDGRLRSDALLFEVGQGCSGLTSEVACLANAESAAIACAWKVEERLCVSVRILFYVFIATRVTHTLTILPLK
ncbi:Attractin-like protein 1 [Eumeta japonica]|uniref:Attractin-like protein 1 n=1 Tax=Eumeta variegata TaxID=151549 RepID=A0A4C1TSI7_EUMVA|nr:Attractin-like protein 1 [Eumeta japonica]